MSKCIKSLLSAMLFAVIIIAFSSCEHKDLCYHHPHGVKLKVVFDWKNAPEAFAKGMCIYFYPVDGGTYRRFDFPNMQGGYIELAEGTYNVICYNNDTEGVMFGGVTDYYNHSLFTREGDLFEPINERDTSNVKRAEGSEDERVVITPDMMWGCAVTQVEVAETGLTYTHETITSDMKAPQLNVENTAEDFILTFYPEDLMCHYMVKIINVVNLQKGLQMCASLSGMSGGLSLSSNELGRECVTLPFKANIADSTTIISEFYTFGHQEENLNPHKVILYVWYSKKNVKAYPYDAQVIEGDSVNEDLEERFNVTNQIHNAQNKRKVELIIDGLVLDTISFKPKPPYDTSVDDWVNVNEIITVG
ncbi:MAG: DUF5119 domain-containing protein [Bacteroidales bacterium]|nr:DUF5119 domain-containing protein [Bacteroidales bacterium]